MQTNWLLSLYQRERFKFNIYYPAKEGNRIIAKWDFKNKKNKWSKTRENRKFRNKVSHL